MEQSTKALLVTGVCALLLAGHTAIADQARAAQNNPPETYIVLDTLEVIQPNFISPQVIRSRTYYSLPESTATYPGIVAGWSGSDSLDHPGAQPAFEFNWVLFGPFADQGSTVIDSGQIARTNDDPVTGEIEWTDRTTHAFRDLRTGWYLFWVRARDDSLEADPTPAVARFPVVEPAFDRPFMLLDASNWFCGALLNAGSIDFRDPRTDSLTRDTIQAMYDDLFSGQGYAFDPGVDVWHRQMDSPIDAYRALPDRDVLAHYKALIVYDEDVIRPLDIDNYAGEFVARLGEYLDVGGRVVLIGRDLFAASVDLWGPINEPPLDEPMPPTSFARDYFGVESMHFAQDLYYAISDEDDSAEFVGTTPAAPHFPPLAVDTLRTLLLAQFPVPGLTDRDGDGFNNWLWVPDVNWVTIDSSAGAEALYTYNSAYPGTSSAQDRICGSGYEYYDVLLGQPTYRTALLTFPLFPLRQDPELRAMVQALLDYMLTDDVVAGIGDDGVRPLGFRLLPNYPNPFNAGTTLRYALDHTGDVTITIYNVLGQRLRILVDKGQPAGLHDVTWNGTDNLGRPVSSGVYFYRLEYGGRAETGRMLLLK